MSSRADPQDPTEMSLSNDGRDSDASSDPSLRRPGVMGLRVALYVFRATAVASLGPWLERIPEDIRSGLEEIVLMRGAEWKLSPAEIASLADRLHTRLRAHRSPMPFSIGGERKNAFEDARLAGFDSVIFIRADGGQPPEALAPLLAAIREQPDRVLIASRFIERREAWRAGMPALRLLGYAITTSLQNRLLGLHLRDYQSSFRAYPMAAVVRVPYQLDGEGDAFDAEILIQLRALGVPITEVAALPAWREYVGDREGFARVLEACATALGYRFHQLHLTRDGRYLVEHDVRYTLKRSPSSSHAQIIESIEPESRVLDIGCSQGLLARPLAERNIRVVGVDALAPERVVPEIESYFQRDLEQPLDLPLGRDFDYIVVADVIEHLRERRELLVGARRFLKENGRLIVSAPNIALWFYRLSLLVGRFEYGPRGVLDRTHVHLYTRATLRREVRAAGFTIERERVTALPFELVFESTGRSRLVRSIASIYHMLARMWPELFAYQIILEARITTLDEDASRALRA
jgi:2-polyprenyl-3-methyl-5-hydroxy-6-metoxy-1,4-benzoquinol methylase